MSEDDYEILPHQLLSDLKYDVEALKKKLSEPDAKAIELILEIESFKDSLHELTTVFQKALEEVKGEDNIAKTIKTLQEKIDDVVSQNETIAKGMIAISDKVEDFIQKQNLKPKMEASVPMNAPPMMLNPSVKHTVGLPTPGMERMAPRPMVNPQMPLTPLGGADFPLPPPSPPGKKRGGLFR